MENKEQSDLIDYCKLALVRNDESIRFAESKAGFLFSAVGIMLGYLATEIAVFKEALIIGNPQLPLAIIALVLIGIGTIMTAVSTLLIVFPRLKIGREGSYLYFGSVQSLSAKQFCQKGSQLSSKMIIEQLLTQVHATAVIVWKKYYFVRLEFIGTILVFLGWLLAIFLIFQIG